MFRSTDNIQCDTATNWDTRNPIIMYNVLAIETDTGNMKLGDGTNYWSDLQYIGNGSSGVGVLLSETELSSDTTVYNEFVSIIETDDITEIPTGRFKIGDGITQVDNLPFFGGILVCGEFATGVIDKTIVWSGYEWVNKAVYTEDDFAFPTVPTGIHFLRDDKTFATIPTIYGPLSSVNDNIVTFDGTDGIHYKDSGVSIDSIITEGGTPADTFQVDIGVGPKLTNVAGDLEVYKDDGTTLANITSAETYADYGIFGTINVGFPTESSSVTLTSDGTYLYTDGGKIIDVNHDGHGSGLDADTIDGYHVAELVLANTALVEEAALVYSIVMGG